MARAARRRRGGRSPFAVGVVALVVLAILVFLGFTKDIPFVRGHQVKAVFTSANGLRPSSPVRIAGVDVGEVVAVDGQEGGDGAVVTMEIDESGLPLHTDATAKIRPRIFLEGNFFVDLKPGSPGAPELGDGDTIKVTQTATPVQLDEVLTSLQSDSRADLQDVLRVIGTAWTAEPTAAQNRDADPSARGQSAAESFNDAYDDIGPAERAQSQVNEALLGIEPERDLQRLIAGAGRTAAGLARNETQLRDLVSNFNTTMAALAAEDTALRAAVALLPDTLATANSAFSALNAAFPPTRAFALEILPGVRETAATIDAAFPWIRAMRALLAPSELQGLAADLAPAARDLAQLTDTSLDLLPQTNLLSLCAADVLLPTGDVVIRDEFSTGRENYKELLYGMVGLAGEGQNFDGNGMYVRFQTGGGTHQVAAGPSSLGNPPQYGSLPIPPIGNRPAYPGRRSPYRPEEPCYRQRRPDLNGPAAALTLPGGTVATAATAGNAKALARLRPTLERAGAGSR
jgi:virulence factor Mce-like protein